MHEYASIKIHLLKQFMERKYHFTNFRVVNTRNKFQHNSYVILNEKFILVRVTLVTSKLIEDIKRKIN